MLWLSCYALVCSVNKAYCYIARNQRRQKGETAKADGRNRWEAAGPAVARNRSRNNQKRCKMQLVAPEGCTGSTLSLYKETI